MTETYQEITVLAHYLRLWIQGPEDLKELKRAASGGQGSGARRDWIGMRTF